MLNIGLGKICELIDKNPKAGFLFSVHPGFTAQLRWIFPALPPGLRRSCEEKERWADRSQHPQAVRSKMAFTGAASRRRVGRAQAISRESQAKPRAASFAA